MLVWLPLLAADPVVDATGTLAKQGVLGGLLAAALVVIGVLWRRDQARNAAELVRLQDAHTREVDLLKAERARETTRADAEARARSELEREVRDRHLPTLAQAVDTLADSLRESRRRS